MSEKKLANKRVAIRLNEKELTKLEESAKVYGLSVGKFLKKTALDVRLRKPVFTHEESQKAIRELSAQGRNLNQIAKHLNEGGQVPAEEFQRILKGYAEIWRLLQK